MPLIYCNLISKSCLRGYGYAQLLENDSECCVCDVQMYTGYMLRPYVPLGDRYAKDHDEAGTVSNQDAAAARFANSMALESRQVSCNAARMV